MLRQVVTLPLKAHLGNSHALFHLWSQFVCRRQQEPGNRHYVLSADCSWHDGRRCEVVAVVETGEHGEERVTLMLPQEEC